jgi:cytochrome c oxidase subunit III
MSSTIATPVNSRTPALPQAKRGSAHSVALARQADRASRSGIWVGLFAITMSFAAFSSALFVRQGTMDWTHIILPSVLYLNTLLLLASSATLEVARRSLTAASPVDSNAAARKASAWVILTLVLGLVFCVGQFAAWRDLRAQGIYLTTNPNSSFFYVLTFIHALHVFAGIAALVYLAGRLTASHSTFRRSLFENTAIYWHFMAVLWAYLFLLCLMKL